MLNVDIRKTLSQYIMRIIETNNTFAPAKK
jgi:hypothetical protein